MNAIAERARGTGRTRSWSLRTYLAGGTATSALIAGAVIVFVSLATFVAFNGFSDGNDGGGDDGAVVVGARGAPEAAAAAVGAAPGAVAAAPAASTAVAPTGPAPATTGVTGAAPGVAGTQATGGDSGSVDGGTVSQTPTDPTTPAGSGSTGSGGGGPIDTAVSGLENTASNLGVDADLGGLDNVTQQVDNTVNNTLNNAGGVLGNPQLGDQVSGTVNDATSQVLGQGGLTDQLLGGQ